MEDTNIYSTRDLTLAATLITLKFKMVGIDYQIEGQQRKPVGYFKFEESEFLREARQKFTQGMLAVEPKQFMTNVHSLKAEVTNYFVNPHNKTF